MTEICQEYIKEIKTIFPVKGKNEKKYIRELSVNVEEFIIEESISDKEDLYNNFGKPLEIISEYFSNVETAYLIKKIRFSKFIKAFITVLITVLLAVSAMLCVFEIQSQQMALREEAVISDEEIDVIDRGEISDEEFEKQLASSEKETVQ